MHSTRFSQLNSVEPKTLIQSWLQQGQTIRPFWPFPSTFQGIVDRLAKSDGINMERRSLVANALEQQYQDAGMAIPANLKAFRSGARAVTTGHQLVLMGGPAFFHYKIMSAVRWAESLSEQGVVAVPVFWLASEDHDFEEIARVFSREQAPFHWQPDADPQAKAVGRLLWTPEDEEALAEWAQQSDVLPMDSIAGSTPMSLAQRVRLWIHDMFEGLGVLVIDGDDPALKEMAGHLWSAEWKGQGIAEAVKHSTAALELAGWKAQLRIQENNLFHLNSEGERTRADRWIKEQRALAWQDEPEFNWSPNAALRPIYQEFLLQSAAVIGGPGEIAYWLQLGGAFQHHAVEQPALMLRDGALVWSKEQAALAKEVGWSPITGMWTGMEASNRWVSMHMDPDNEVHRAWDEWGKALEAHAVGMGRDVLPTTRASLSNMEKEWLRLQKKWRKAVRSRHVVKCQQLEVLFDGVLFPEGSPQERLINVRALVQDENSLAGLNRTWLEKSKDSVEPVFFVFESL